MSFSMNSLRLCQKTLECVRNGDYPRRGCDYPCLTEMKCADAMLYWSNKGNPLVLIELQCPKCGHHETWFWSSSTCRWKLVKEEPRDVPEPCNDELLGEED